MQLSQRQKAEHNYRVGLDCASQAVEAVRPFGANDADEIMTGAKVLSADFVEGYAHALEMAQMVIRHLREDSEFRS